MMGWWYHLKHVEQFPFKINCVMLHLVGYILESNRRLRLPLLPAWAYMQVFTDRSR
jgi:hypothetical protein